MKERQIFGKNIQNDTINNITNDVFNKMQQNPLYIKEFIELKPLKNKNVVVVGAGVVGLVNAFYLNLCGANVVIHEKNSDICLSASMQNGGQLSFSHVDSIASFKNLLNILKFSKAIRISPVLFFSKRFLLFIKQYLVSCLPRNRSKNLLTLNNLSKLSKAVFFDSFCEYFTPQNLKDCNYNKDGTLHYFYDQKYFLSKILHYKNLGIDFKILTKEELIETDEGLVNIQNLCGGLFFECDHSINCKKMCHIIKDLLIQNGVEFVFNTEFDYTTALNDRSLAYVFANGSDSYKILTYLNTRLNIYPMTGYSFNVDTSYSSYAPQHALTDSANRIVYSVQKNYDSANINYNKFTDLEILRVAGFADFLPISVENSKQKALKQQVKRTKHLYKVFLKCFRSLRQSAVLSKWIGFRPSTPNSVPIIISCKHYGFENIFVNAGHTNLGLTLSFGSAFANVQMIVGNFTAK